MAHQNTKAQTVKIPDSRVIAHSALQPKWRVRFTYVLEFVKTMLMAKPRFTNKQGYLHAQRNQVNPRLKLHQSCSHRRMVQNQK